VRKNGRAVAVSPEVSVVIPLTDARGDAVDHLRTWTHGQTLDRGRYQVVIASDGAEPGLDRDVAALLGAHDRFEVAPGASMIELWNHAAELAAADWLLFSENHVQAEPDCIERALAGIDANPGLDAASIDHGHIAPDPVGKLGARWFDEVYGEWSQPEQWQRLNLAGFVIRRDLHRAVGGHQGRYGLFAAPLLSAELDRRGDAVGHIPEARILHIQCEQIEEHHEHSADYVIGESEARTALDPEFAEHYFGFRPLVWNRRRLEPRAARRAILLLGRELLRSARRRRGDSGWLLRALAARIPDALPGRPRRRLAELGFRWSERMAASRWVPRSLRYRAYLRAQERVTRLAQLRWIETRADGAPAAVGNGSHPIEAVGEGTIVGVHGLETHAGRRFRWSEPVVTMCVSSPTGDRLRIETDGLRGSPRGFVAAAYAGSRRLPNRAIREEGTRVVIDLPDGSFELTLLCRPLPHGADERRELGLPIFSVELGDVSTPADSPADREPAGVA
jgi:hypothetical protein